MRKKLIELSAFLIIGTGALVTMQSNYEMAISIKDEQIQSLTNANDGLYQMYTDVKTELDTWKSLDLNNYSKVRFTNYYVGDGSSGKRTGSGKTTADFKVNDKGFYTYNGKVVIATATWECIESEYEACKNYTSVPRGYEIYRYGDETEIIIDGVKYEAIVLDSCGGSYWKEDLQRVDIFVAHGRYNFGDKVGYIGE